MPDDPAIVKLPIEGAAASLQKPTGTLMVWTDHLSVHGQIDDIERFASAMIAACYEARRVKRDAIRSP